MGLKLLFVVVINFVSGVTHSFADHFFFCTSVKSACWSELKMTFEVLICHVEVWACFLVRFLKSHWLTEYCLRFRLPPTPTLGQPRCPSLSLTHRGAQCTVLLQFGWFSISWFSLKKNYYIMFCEMEFTWKKWRMNFESKVPLRVALSSPSSCNTHAIRDL